MPGDAPDMADVALSRLRAAIEEVDEQLLVLLAQRIELVREIAARKYHRGDPAISPRRERFLREQWHRWARQLNLDADSVEALFLTVVRRGIAADGLQERALPPASPVQKEAGRAAGRGHS